MAQFRLDRRGAPLVAITPRADLHFSSIVKKKHIFPAFSQQTPSVVPLFSPGLQWSQALQLLELSEAPNVVQLSAALSACEKVPDEDFFWMINHH